MTGRMGRSGTWGPDGVRQRTSAANWRKPVAWDRESAAQGRKRYGGRADERIRVFCASLADVFEPRPELEPWRHDLLELIQATPNLDWLLLTKRPDVARDLYYAGGWALTDNLWLGASVENSRFTWRADALRQIPVAVRFLSCEPLVGSLFQDCPDCDGRGFQVRRVGEDEYEPEECRCGGMRRALDLTGIDWVIAGGESGGRNARPMHPAWVRELRDAVLAEALRSPFLAEGHHPRPAFHFKQWGSYAPSGFVSGLESGDPWTHKVVRGDRSSVREGERVDWTIPYRGPGPKAGGKILDGVEWCEIPESRGVLVA